MIKFKLVILIILIFSNELYSQTIKPTKETFTWRSSKLISGSIVDTTYNNEFMYKSLFEFDKDSFQLGWHWAGHKSMNSALNFNLSHIGFWSYGSDPSSVIDVKQIAYNSQKNSNVIACIPRITSDNRVDSPLNALSMEFKPTLKIDPNKYGQLQTDLNDPEKSVFGFEYKNSSCKDTLTSGAFSRSLLLANRDSFKLETLILDKNWPRTKIYIFGDKDTSTSYFNGIYGYRYYLTIHLKGFNLDTFNLNARVLKLKLKYKYYTYQSNAWIADSTYLKFDSLPNPNQITFNNANIRGRSLFLRDSSRGPVYPTDFIITKGMLPNDNVNDNYVTISAHFLMLKLIGTM